MNDIKKNLIKLLKSDSDIQDEIRKICLHDIPINATHEDPSKNINIIESQKKEISSLLINLKKSDKMIESLKNKLGLNKNSHLQSTIDDQISVITELKETNADLKKEIKDYQDKLKKYDDSFAKEVAVYKLFNNLSKKTKPSLSNIFKDDTLAGFVACGVQEKNINNLWEYIKSEDIENKNTDLPALKQIFEFLFSRYSTAYPMFEPQQVVEGDTFDPQQHIKHSNSQHVSGKIQEVSFQGWVNNKTGKVVKQSVVIL